MRASETLSRDRNRGNEQRGRIDVSQGRADETASLPLRISLALDRV
jgi:hypothetical protein